MNIIFKSMGFLSTIDFADIFLSVRLLTIQNIYIYFFIKATLREDYCFLRPQEPNQESLLFYG